MKYVIVIADGAADRPLEELGDRTPFEAASIPHIDRLARQGRLGAAATTPAGFPCGSDVCSMSLLGYDPARHHRGRAPLEAAALGLDLDPADWVFRVNFVTVVDGRMQDHSAGQITSEEGRQLLEAIGAEVRLPQGMSLFPGVSYRNIMLDVSGRTGASRDWGSLITTPPHDVPGEPIRRHLPRGGRDADLLRDLIDASADILANHEVNRTREELGESPATHLWPWGQGVRPTTPSFASRFKLKGAMITAVDLLAGIARFIEWDRLDVPGQTSYHDTDYAAAGRHAIAALDDYDIVCVHIEAPDEASHAGDAATKVAAIEAIDQHVIGPILEHFEAGDEPWRMLVLPDHYTLVSTRKHDPTPVPFAMAGHRIRSVVQHDMSERNAHEADLHIDFGHELMEYFLFSGQN